MADGNSQTGKKSQKDNPPALRPIVKDRTVNQFVVFFDHG